VEGKSVFGAEGIGFQALHWCMCSWVLCMGCKFVCVVVFVYFYMFFFYIWLGGYQFFGSGVVDGVSRSVFCAFVGCVFHGGVQIGFRWRGILW
jgi:hypothetical protein